MHHVALAAALASGLLAGIFMSSPRPQEASPSVSGSEARVVERPKDVELAAQELFARPLEAQTESELRAITERASRVMSRVGTMIARYGDARRSIRTNAEVLQNFDFHVMELQKLVVSMAEVATQATFNMAEQRLARGHEHEAYELYESVFKAAVFADPDGDHKGLRYKAEKQMKALMGTSLGAFVY